MRTTKKWTDEDRARIAEMLRDKQTSAQIANAFGVEKNSIIGIVHRDKSLKAIGFNWRIAHPTRIGAPPRRKAATKQRTTTAMRQRIKLSLIPGVLSAPRHMPQKQSLLAFKPVPLPTPVPTVFECRSVPMMELRPRECRWPVNDAAPSEHLFCGNQADGGSYCAGHAALSIGLGTVSERRAAQELARHTIDRIAQQQARRAA